jgi:cyanate permease
MGDHHARAAEKQRENAAVVASGWAGVLLVAAGAAGLYFVPGALPVWVVLIVFGVTALPMALLALRRDPARRDRRRR